MLIRHISAVIIVNDNVVFHRHRAFLDTGTGTMFLQHTQYPKSLPKAIDKGTEDSVPELVILHKLFLSLSQMGINIIGILLLEIKMRQQITWSAASFVLLRIHTLYPSQRGIL